MQDTVRLFFWNILCGLPAFALCNIVTLQPATRLLPYYSVFTQKQVSGHRTAKSQPIWIKFAHTYCCTEYTVLWADLDRYRRVGDSRPIQNDYVFRLDALA